MAVEVDLINVRLRGTEEQKAKVLPLVLSGDEKTSLPPLMRGRVYADFRAESRYFEVLSELIFTLYNLPFDDPLVISVRELITTEEEGEA